MDLEAYSTAGEEFWSRHKPGGVRVTFWDNDEKVV